MRRGLRWCSPACAISGIEGLGRRSICSCFVSRETGDPVKFFVKFCQAFCQENACFCQVFPKIPLAVLSLFKTLRGGKSFFREFAFRQVFELRRAAVPAFLPSQHASTNSVFQEGFFQNTAGKRKPQSIASTWANLPPDRSSSCATRARTPPGGAARRGSVRWPRQAPARRDDGRLRRRVRARRRRRRGRRGQPAAPQDSPR
jgi:hypothetical protein